MTCSAHPGRVRGTGSSYCVVPSPPAIETVIETMDEWTELTDWWLEEIDEPAYLEEVVPLFLDVAGDLNGRRVLDLGCGEGRVLGLVAERGASVIGVDVNRSLARRARRHGPVVLGRLPSLRFLVDGSADAAYVVLAMEHVRESAALFAETARVVRTGGWLAVVLNHPVYTAPNSGPVLDTTDGELFWRFGDYLTEGSTQEPAGEDTVEFVHRPIAAVLNQAADAGWSLEHVVERGVGEAATRRDPLLAKHHEIPHLMGVRWRRR